MSNENRVVLSVGELTRSAKRLLEHEFPLVYVEGEIGNFSSPASGHWYFNLKDEKAQVRCAMFKNRNHFIRFKPRVGLQVVARGRISLYEGRGEFQMIVDFLEEAGDGALRRAFEKLKNQLQHEGLFEQTRKQSLPTLPNHICVITSPTGAAVRDVLHVLQRRFPSIPVSILPVSVQGDEAVGQIVDALALANDANMFDCILLTRGGGSLEDLWAFNTEPVARAIAESKLPVLSAIGHETDVTIADFVADLRAPTPSAAAEILSPDITTIARQISSLEQQLSVSARRHITNRVQELQLTRKRLRHPGERLDDLSVLIILSPG